MIAQIAQSPADRGATHLINFMTAGERKAFLTGGNLNSARLGHAVHRATSQTLDNLYPGRFNYNPTRPYDFLDQQTGQAIELTTFGQSRSHADRAADAAYYSLPR